LELFSPAGDIHAPAFCLINRMITEGLTMSEFRNITVVKKANVYFDGKVTSRTVLFPDGTKKTLGIMLPGDYEFGTADKEIMEILAGDLTALLPGSADWQTFREGMSFEVPANSKFCLNVKTVTDYCCSYVK
jgi:purine/pyrimidine-nucleoside phosphorylase